MATKTKKKVLKTNPDETDFLKNFLDKLLSINQQLDLRAYPLLGISSLIFIFSLFNILNDHEKGVVGFIVIGVCALISVVFTWLALKQTANGHGYGKLLLNGLAGADEQEFELNLTNFFKTKTNVSRLYRWQVYSLYLISENKKRRLDMGMTVLVIGLMVGLILVISLP